MHSILKAGIADAELIAAIATQTFFESHGHSADPATIQDYVAVKYNADILKEELADTKNIYHVIYHDDRAAGYSKILFNCPFENSPEENIAKLERIYILQEYYDKRIGQALFQFNVDLAKKNKQAGFWLYVWKENKRAVRFYEKNGFVINGSYDFNLSGKHSNPNHRLFLRF